MAFFRGLYRLLPKWLREGESALVDYSTGIMLDAMAERFRLSAYARMPSYAPEDALAYLARDRRLVRGIGESAEDFAVRLVQWLPDRAVQGNPFALLKKLQEYLQAQVRVRTVDVRGNWYTREYDGTESAELDAGNWDWDARDPSRWSSFWVVLYPAGATDPWAVTALTIGDVNLWGGAIGNLDPLGNAVDKKLTIGTTAEPEHIARIRQIIREWQPDGTRCEWVIVAFNSASFDPTAVSEPTPNPGTWAKWGKLSGTDYVAARSSTHRYFRGMAGSEYP